jgi:lambda repressor-like predicted transcriptional regulator
MEPIDINYQLHKHKSSQAAIAKKLKVKRQTVNGVVHGKIVSRRIRKYIAKVIGLKINDLWPNAA